MAHANRLLPPVPADAPVPTARSRSSVRSLLIGMLAGVVLGIGIAGTMAAMKSHVQRDLFDGYGSTGGALAILLLAMFASILLHEIGHVVGGLGVGFRFMLLVAGPLRVERGPSGGIRVALNKHLASGGGLAALHPTDQHDLVRRFSWMVAAGPIGSLATTAICSAMFAVMQEQGMLKSFAGTLAGLSLATALATLTPMKSGFYLTDGARLLQLRRGGPAAERDAALLSLLASNSTDAPIESWDRASVLAGIEPPDGSIFELQGRMYAYTWAMANRAIDDARAQLQRAFAISAGLPGMLRASVENEMAFLDAMHPPVDSPAAELREPQAPGLQEQDRLRTLAAIALSRGDVALAEEHVSAARRLITSGAKASSGCAKWDLDRLREIEARLA